ncbi:MAG: L-threonylcarbamoyladenylate synthase [Candidatus Thermoplasmatota archaeon]|nr:L-threonylcarbamoyladenylate synthase [Candidatus Thermoplasmatota archaeon]
MTLILKVDSSNPDKGAIAKAAQIIRSGGLVAFPTETVYGLGANALDGAAVKKIYEAKGRPSDNPMIVHIADKKALAQIAEVTPSAEKLAGVFWPGPLTIVLKKKKIVPKETTGGLDTVAVRMPDHLVALALISEADVPIAAPSANLSGKPSPTKAAHVIEDFNGKIDCIIDGGSSRIGLESTVLDLTSEIPTILRPGFITPEDVRDVLGSVAIHPGATGKVDEGNAKSPGMKYRHYAPKAKMILFEGEKEKVLARIAKEAKAQKSAGVLLFDDIPGISKKIKILVGGNTSNNIETQCRIYDALREFDTRGVDLILAQGIAPEGFGLAIMNRLRRAAGYSIVNV